MSVTALRKARRLAIWGTGSAALTAVRVLKLEPHRVFSSQGGGKFLGLEVEPGASVDQSVDALAVCSMFYQDITKYLETQGFPLDRVRVFHDHRIHPEFMLNEVTDFDLEHSDGHLSELVSETLTPEAVTIADRIRHLEQAYEVAPSDGLALEFGVWRGETLLHLQSLSDRLVFGFDSNRGFSGKDWASLHFHGFSPVPSDLRDHPGFIEGWFQDTLPAFLMEHRDPIAFVHYDAGEIGAARFVLRTILPKLAPEAVLVFDEMLETRDRAVGSSPEWIAWHEVIRESGRSFEWLARSGYSASLRMCD